MSRTALGTLAAVLALAVIPAAANADAAPTTTTFSITGGSLVITAPATSALGSAAPGATLSASLGAVSVTDTRALLVAAWTATASTTTFTTGAGTAPLTIGQSAVSYASGAATASTGVGVFTPGQATTLLAAAMTTSVTAYTLTLGVGNNSATWNPTVVIAVPAAAVAGAYSGTITHSVA